MRIFMKLLNMTYLSKNLNFFLWSFYFLVLSVHSVPSFLNICFFFGLLTYSTNAMQDCSSVFSESVYC